MKVAAGNTEQQTADSSDWLGYGEYADTLWDRVKSSFAQPGAKSDVGTDPLVIGVFGEWGAGK